MSGYLFLNSCATPFPMIPTQLTVFTRVCASLANRSPISALNIRTFSLTKEYCRIDRYRQVKAETLQLFQSYGVDNVSTYQILCFHVMRHQYLGAFLRTMTKVRNLIIRVSPVQRK